MHAKNIFVSASIPRHLLLLLFFKKSYVGFIYILVILLGSMHHCILSMQRFPLVQWVFPLFPSSECAQTCLGTPRGLEEPLEWILGGIGKESLIVQAEMAEVAPLCWQGALLSAALDTTRCDYCL